MKKHLLIFPAILAICSPAQAITTQVRDDSKGYQIGTTATQKVGFLGATPVVQQSSADQTALTDNTGGSVADAILADSFTSGTAFTDNSTGSAGTTLAAGVGIETITVPVVLAQIAGTSDVVTALTPGYKFKILSFDAFVVSAVTTGSKAVSLNIEIGSTDLTGGVIALTSSNCTPLGAKIAGTSITAANTGTASDNISVEASSVTAFVEGQVFLQIRIQNMDTADAVASLSSRANTLRTDTSTITDCLAKITELLNNLRSVLVTYGLIKGSA